MMNSVECIRVLLEQGADPLAEDDGSVTPLELAKDDDTRDMLEDAKDNMRQ